tara:strand:+ start:1105 stop:1656 length:552 start_codon:yes stop_codon:yes gene_type:complete
MIDKKISKIIKARRTTYPRNFNGAKIKREVIEEILENANHAPSHRMTQPWFFKVFTDEKKNDLANAIIKLNSNYSDSFKKKMFEKFEKTSHIIVICLKRHEDVVPEWEEVAATSMSVQNIWLSIVNSKIGGYWSTPKYLNNLNKYLELKKNERCLGFFFLGLVDSFKIRNISRTNAREKTSWK